MPYNLKTVFAKKLGQYSVSPIVTSARENARPIEQGKRVKATIS